MDVNVRDYTQADHDGVNLLALAAFAQYQQFYDDWPAFMDGIGKIKALPPIRGVDYARYVLDGSAIPAALALLDQRRSGKP